MKNVNRILAVGLLSGGLDSAVAARLILDQGIEVHAVNIDMPWGCGRPSRSERLALAWQMPFKSVPLQDDYLSILRKPKYGFGSAHNPCIDCHIYMVRRAADYMREIGAAFVFTGEVLGQRPMSQRRVCLERVERDSGIPGRLLRPLSAKLLPATLPEEEGLVDRGKLLDISGRSRFRQLALAKEMGIEEFSAPGGGCLLTEKFFGARIKDVLDHGCANIASTSVLGIGRYLRLDGATYILVGRDALENDKLVRYAMPADIILRPEKFPGPVVLLRSDMVTEEKIVLAAGLAQFYSKFRAQAPLPLMCWQVGRPLDRREVFAGVVDEAVIQKCIQRV